MKQVGLVALVMLVAACAPGPKPAASATPARTARPALTTVATATPVPMPPLILHRGVNMGNMLEAPHEGDWGLTVHEEYFDLIRQAGFDFVRLSVRWSAHTTPHGQDDGGVYLVIDPAFFTRVDEVVGWALERNLGVILDFHHYEELISDPNEEQFLFLWQQIAEHYRDEPPQVLFELLNEPTGALDAGLWNTYIRDVMKVIRRTNPDRDVVIGPALWNRYNLISTLELPDDPHIIATFHFYDPFQFTHQGAEWVGPESNSWIGTTWQGTEAEKQSIRIAFDSVAKWAAHRQVRVLLGEFGAYSVADMPSRVRWTGFVAREAERHGFAWAYWEFGSGFGIYDPQADRWRPELLRALLPEK